MLLSADQIARRFAEPLTVLTMGPASLWLAALEARILRSGRALDGEGRALAEAAGVVEVDRVRTLVAGQIPGATAALTRLLGRWSRTVVTDPIALTARYGILLTPRAEDDPEILAHELIHVAQFERMGGGISSFLANYITGCLRDGYWDSVLEQEARACARRIVTTGRR